MFETANVSIFAGSSGRVFAERMCSYMGKPLGSCEVITFSEGNTFVRVNESVRDRDVILVQPIGMRSNDEFVEILFWMDAFKRANANTVTLVMPYFGYGKGDKKDEPRVSIRARVCAECMELAGADRFATMDLHAQQLQGFFKRPMDHLYAMPMLTEVIKRHVGAENTVIVSPDAGGVERARSYAKRLNAPLAIVDKRRDKPNQAHAMHVIGDVKGKTAIIVDDMIDTAGTLCAAADVLLKNGAVKIIACATHAVLSGPAIDRINATDALSGVYVTDTIPLGEKLERCSKLHVVGVGSLLGKAISNIHTGSSVSVLFV